MLKFLEILVLVIRYNCHQSCESKYVQTLCCQILGVTCDNGSNNDKMIDHLAALVNTFPGAANQTQCFTYILNFVAKSVLCQFEALKAKGGDVLDNAAKELTAIFDELEDSEDKDKR